MIGPPLPRAMEGVWLDFLDVCGKRGSAAHGPAPLTYPDLESWGRLTGADVSPWRVRAIMAVDRVFLDAFTPKSTPKPA